MKQPPVLAQVTLAIMEGLVLMVQVDICAFVYLRLKDYNAIHKRISVNPILAKTVSYSSQLFKTNLNVSVFYCEYFRCKMALLFMIIFIFRWKLHP